VIEPRRMARMRNGAARRSVLRPMRRLAARPSLGQLALVGLLFGVGGVVCATPVSAAPRMAIGFHDDATFRWSPGAADEVARAAGAHASVIRTIAEWRSLAPRRPGVATDSFDPAYDFRDLDELVRNSQRQGIQVMITIWGSPGWANGGKPRNVPPIRPADLTAFARAIADRYSGRHPGYPYVGRYSIWNEPNLEIFLAPQFDRKGAISSPHTYAALYRAGYAGVKKGNATALVAIGETSNQGRDHPAEGTTADSVAPGTFARLLAREPGLRFDAYATHPYPTRPNAPPTEKVRWPNIALSQLPRLEASLDRWFGRQSVPVWITEYAYQTRPGDPYGVSEAQQATYLAHVMKQLKADRRVQMLIWFIFRDSESSHWQSGISRISGRPKLAYDVFSSLALSVRGQTLQVSAGVRPTIGLPVPRLAFVTPAGSTIGVTYRVFQGTRLVAMGQPAPRLLTNQSVRFVANFKPARGQSYDIEMDAGDISGNHAFATYTLLATAGTTVPTPLSR
jgi:hypothetical protein